MSILNFFKGFAVTLGKLNHASESGEVVTTHYPEEKRSKPKRLHGRHVLNRYEDGMEKVHRMRTMRQCLSSKLHLCSRS